MCQPSLVLNTNTGFQYVVIPPGQALVLGLAGTQELVDGVPHRRFQPPSTVVPFMAQSPETLVSIQVMFFLCGIQNDKTRFRADVFVAKADSPMDFKKKLTMQRTVSCFSPLPMVRLHNRHTRIFLDNNDRVLIVASAEKTKSKLPSGVMVQPLVAQLSFSVVP